MSELSLLQYSDLPKQQNYRIRVARRVRSGLFEEQKSMSDREYAITAVQNAEQLDQAMCLVHDCYVERGFIKPIDQGKRIRIFEQSNVLSTFIALDGSDVVVGTIGIVSDSDIGLPSEKFFAEEIGLIRSSGNRIIEITNLAMVPDSRGRSLFLDLSRLVIAYALSHCVDKIFIAVSPSHASIYHSIFQFDQIGDVRTYCDETCDSVVGMVMSMDECFARAKKMDALLGNNSFIIDLLSTKNPFIKDKSFWAPTVIRYGA